MSQKLPNDELLAELRRLDGEVDGEPTAKEMDEHGQYCHVTYHHRFGSWNKAKKEAGVRDEVTQEELVKEIQRIGESLGHRPTKKDLAERSDISVWQFRTKFDTVGESIQQAGFDVNTSPRRQTPKQELVEELHRLRDQLGRTPRSGDIRDQSSYSVRVFQERFGSWNSALESAGLELNRLSNGEVGQLYYGSNWERQREIAKSRDNYRCQDCGLTERTSKAKFGCGLDVHHKIPLKEYDQDGSMNYAGANKLSNLVTMCRSCHISLECNPQRRDI